MAHVTSSRSRSLSLSLSRGWPARRAARPLKKHARSRAACAATDSQKAPPIHRREDRGIAPGTTSKLTAPSSVFSLGASPTAHWLLLLLGGPQPPPPPPPPLSLITRIQAWADRGRLRRGVPERPLGASSANAVKVSRANRTRRGWCLCPCIYRSYISQSCAP